MEANNERRICRDRRIHDQGPPRGWRDRRRAVERRGVELAEVQVSDADWERYFGPDAQPAAADGHADDTLVIDVAAEVFDRIRD